MNNQKTLLHFEPAVVQAENVLLWVESFGDINNPPIILIMGSGGQGIMWPQEFCEALAAQGFFVIRYDHRDTGLSTSIDYESHPYTLLDLAKDITFIIDHFQLKDVTVLGASMGGSVAMLLAAHYPDYVGRLILMITTPDMRPAFEAYQGLTSTSKLSPPLPEIIAATKNIINPPETLEEQVQLYLDTWELNSNSPIPIDEAMCRQIALQCIVRMKNPAGVNNHFMAICASYELLDQAPAAIKAPTLIIHGECDPVFPLDHGYALHAALPQAELSIIPDLGHGLASKRLFAPIVERIENFAKNFA